MLKSVVSVVALIAAATALRPGTAAVAVTPADWADSHGPNRAACVVPYAPPADTGGLPFGVTDGPGGVWYSDGDTINRISHVRTTSFTVPSTDPTVNPDIGWLTWDGRDQIWFAARGTGAIGTISGSGAIRTIQVPDGINGTAVPHGFVVHPNDVWFTDQANDRIGDLSLSAGTFSFYQVPSGNPLGLIEGTDNDLYFTERAFDKVGRFDPRTGLFTEWALPTGAFPNRLVPTPDGSVWFTALYGGFVGQIKNGYLTTYPVDGGPVGITYYQGRLWTALSTSGGLAEISLRGRVLRIWSTPGDNPLQVAASRGKLWLTGITDVWSVDPACR